MTSFDDIKDLLPDLINADLSGTDLSEADLINADLSGADLSEADLRKANLSWADLSDANLSGADLTGAILTGADLSGANLREADLSKANLTWADLTRAILCEAVIDGAMVHPTYIGGPGHILYALTDDEHLQIQAMRKGVNKGIPTEQLGDVKAVVEALELTLATAAHFERQASKGTGGRRGGPVFEKARAALAPFRKD